MTGGNWGSVVSAGAAGASALIAERTIYAQQRWQASREILEQEIRFLSLAWQALTDSEKHLSPPRANRRTAARHIVRYQALKASIKDKSHRLICEEQEEFWCHHFYDSLISHELFQPSYPNAEEGGIEKISVVVQAFGKWTSDKEDFLERVDVVGLIREPKLSGGKPSGRDTMGGYSKTSGTTRQ